MVVALAPNYLTGWLPLMMGEVYLDIYVTDST